MTTAPVVTVTDELIAEYIEYHDSDAERGTPCCITEYEMACELRALRDERAELKRELGGLRAARIAYASEFPFTLDGDPDTGSIHANIRELKRDAERYRWLREQEAERGVSVVNINQWLSAATCVAVTFVDGSFVDHAIDAAMQEQKQ